MKLTSHSFHWDIRDTLAGDLPHVSATFVFDHGTSLDLVVKHLEACGSSNTALCDADLQEIEELRKANTNLNNNLNIAQGGIKNLEAELKKLLKDFNDKNAALQEIQGTYVRVHSELKQVRADYEKAVTELDAVKLENIALKRQAEEFKVAQTGNTPVVVMNGPVGEDPKTREYVYEDLPTQVVHDPVDVEEPEEVEPEKTPKDLFRELFVKECADIKGTSPSEVLDQAYAVFTARRAEAAPYGLQRELGSALTMAIADCLNKEPADASALFSVKLDSMKGKAEAAKEAEEKANEPELLTKFNEAMVSPQVKSKTSIRQKIVASLALICAKDGKVRLSDMVNAAEALRKVALKEDEWKTVLDKGGNGKSQLDILHRIVASGLELTVV